MIPSGRTGQLCNMLRYVDTQYRCNHTSHIYIYTHDSVIYSYLWDLIPLGYHEIINPHLPMVAGTLSPEAASPSSPSEPSRRRGCDPPLLVDEIIMNININHWVIYKNINIIMNK